MGRRFFWAWPTFSAISIAIPFCKLLTGRRRHFGIVALGNVRRNCHLTTYRGEYLLVGIGKFYFIYKYLHSMYS
jgi:hypothetical protein